MMKIREILKVRLDPETEDKVELFLLDCFQRLSTEWIDPKDPDRERCYGQLEKVIMEHYSDDQKENVRFMNAITDMESGAEEDCYLLGLLDGIHFMKLISEI